MFVTYVLYSEKFDKIYIGYTSDLVDRFNSHNYLSSKGFTANFRPWIVIYVEFHETKSKAMMREKQLKTSRGREFCRTLINQFEKQ
jgi:putative endonuclease